MSDRILILLATHNGASFLGEQLDSLLSQDCTNWQLLIRDDASGDTTRDIIDQYASADSRFQVMPPSSSPVGARDNFAVLLEEAARREADYVFCCDQDDVWSPQKLDRVLEQLKRAEGARRAPSLVHHDLQVVDENLGPMADSFWNLMALEPRTEAHPQRLLSRNEVTGCALACNASLLRLALPVPAPAIMHDWWLALHAAFLGRLRPMQDRLVRYRQHDLNEVGARSFRAGLNPLTNWSRTWRAGNAEFIATTRQARAFADSLAGRREIDASLVRAVDRYASLPGQGRIARLAALAETGAWRRQWLLDAVLVARMLSLPREVSR